MGGQEREYHEDNVGQRSKNADKSTQHRCWARLVRNPQLQQRLENSSNKRQLLRNVFTKTWELLRTKTRLQEVYKNIQLPDPKDPANIPTVTTLESTVFSFPHDGKRQEK